MQSRPGDKLGRFISFEGGEGVGKSTQVRMLAERLALRGIDNVTTREPGGSPGAEALRKILLSGVVAPLGPMAEALLFAAARIDHLDYLIRPALARGAMIICDRFADSTRAYQGAQGNLDPRQIRALEDVTVGDTRPDITFVLDLPAEIGFERARMRRAGEAADRFEGEDLAFHQGLRQAFLAIAEAEPNRCVVVDARKSPGDIADAVWTIVEVRCFPPRGKSPAKPRGRSTAPAAQPAKT